MCCVDLHLVNFFGDLLSAIDGWLTDREADIICNRWEEGRGKRQQNICSSWEIGSMSPISLSKLGQIGSMSSLIGLNQLFCPRSRRTLVAWHWKTSPQALFWWSASTRRWLICLEMLCRWLLERKKQLTEHLLTLAILKFYNWIWTQMDVKGQVWN